jgi:hypothetical protein
MRNHWTRSAATRAAGAGDRLVSTDMAAGQQAWATAGKEWRGGDGGGLQVLSARG